MKLYSDEGSIGVSFPVTARPHIKRNHIDGPVIIFSDGQLHWLTIWERLLLALGRIDAWKLEQKRRPNLTHFLARYRR